MAVRKSHRGLAEIERNRFVEALYQVKSSGLVDEYAEMHETHFSHGIHRTSHFLPWHREFLLRFEHALQLHHPDITIPYWDSTVATSTTDSLWDHDFLGQFDSAWGLNRSLGGDILPTRILVETNQGQPTYGRFWYDLEGPIHSPPHNWVGGVMASAASPGDPIFFLHHAWLDMLWVTWQRRHPDAPFVQSRPGFGLNDPLMEWPERTPADVLDHHALGYTYDIE